MAFKLKLKRGTAAPSNTALDIAEPGFDTTGKKLYIGNGSGVAASGVSMDGHTHAASDVTSGEFNIARMPTITIAKGGTNITTYTAGDILYASANDVLSKLGIGGVGTVLSVSAGNVPAWVAQVVDTNTTYVLSTEAGDDGYSEKIRLTAGGSGSGTQDAIIAVGQTDGVYGLAIAESGSTITLTHGDTSTLTGAQGTAGIAAITLDGMGHVTAVTTATYLTAEADTLDTVTGRGATTSNNITVGDIAVNGGDITTNQTTFNIGNTATTAQTINLGTAATATATTKAINIGTGGAAGSTTNITIGSTVAGTLTLNSPTVVIPGNLTVTGTVTTNNVETVSTSNGVVFEGSAADENELTLIAGVLTGDRTVTLPDATGTVALTSDLHTRSHTMTSTSDHTAGNWKVFHSNGSGEVVELALSTAGHYLRAGGAAAAPTFAQIAYSEISGTPTIPTVNDGTHTIAGTSNVITVSTTGGAFTANKSSTTTDTLTLAAAFGDTINPYASKTANNVLAAPNGSNGVPTFRALALADLPGISLDDLSDVIITSPSTDSLLQYNGTNWIDVQELDCGTYTS